MKIKLLTIALLLSCSATFSQEKGSFWQKTSKEKVTAIDEKILLPEKNLYELDVEQLKITLSKSPLRGLNAKNKSTIIVAFPDANGMMQRYEVYENPNMDPILAAKYPEIKSYIGTDINNPGSTVYFSMSPLGFKSMTLSSGKSAEFIEPYSKDLKTYSIYKKADKKDSFSKFECKVIDRVKSQKALSPNSLRPNADDAKLRTYRLALSVTAEYTTLFGGTKAKALAAMNNTMTRVNGIFEKDLAVRMVLIANNDALIFTNATTDPYSIPSVGTTPVGNSPAPWNTELQNTLTRLIGNSGYDIGHLFGDSGGGGNAGCIGCVCVNDTASLTDTNKGSGYTSPSGNSPAGDTFDVDYVAHEMGHQFGANHTFTHQDEGTGAQKEPGSGSTIMGYAGITNLDVQNNSDPYFHAYSIEQITNYIKTTTCQTNTATGNAIPTANAGSDFTIPKGTPFTLNGSATDANGDALAYSWEQMDTGTTATSTPAANATAGPAFRSYPPSTATSRTFPKLSSVIANSVTTAGTELTVESLPNVARKMNFRFTVRDNRSGGAANNSDDMIVTVNGTAGPFTITSPNTAVSFAGGSTQTITWNVAGTTGNGVNCANVNILLSTDGGNTYPVTLLSATPNDGSQSVTIPNTLGTTNRIMIKGTNHIFFDISNANFTISSGGTTTNIPTLTAPDNNANVAAPVVLKWTSSVSGASYRLQVSKVNTGWTAANGFTTDATFNSNTPVNYSAAGLITYTWPNADTAAANRPVIGNTYYWTVRSFSAATGTSSYSPVRSFKVTSSTARISNENTNISVYPNPSNGQLAISFDSNTNTADLNLYDLSSNVVFSKNYKTIKGNNTIKEDISNLKSGNYILLLNDGEKVSTQNVVIQNK
jgi:Metallo-peptidase family M12B Reprolysin-like/Secretion system C-terminal sorting domain